LTLRQNLTNKCCSHHNKKDGNTTIPKMTSRLSVWALLQAPKDVGLNNNKEKTCSICMNVTKKPTILDISHNMLDWCKC
jgi:hypothetical protein